MNRSFLVAVCDDDAAVFDTITETAKKAFAENGAEAEVLCFSSPGALEKEMGSRGFDLIFLDIEMPEEDGIRFGERLSRMENTPDIIFVSSREDRVFDAFKIHPFGFVRKSLFPPRSPLRRPLRAIQSRRGRLLPKPGSPIPDAGRGSGS